MEKIRKPKKCLMCTASFIPSQPLQVVCSASCALEFHRQKQWKKEAKKMKEKLMTHKDYLKILQVVFNTYIRMRDKDKPCISCGCDMKNRKGDASHFYSVGSNPSLRFDEDNVHLSCVPCNQYLHGNLLEYAERLPLRIGAYRFDQLKSRKSTINKLTIPEIQDLIKLYKIKNNDLR